MKGLETTAVYLTPDECEQFATFQKHRGLIRILDEVGAFDLKGGSVKLHFDIFGKISGAEVLQHFRAPI